MLGGTAAVEQAAQDAGHDGIVPFTPGRTDATEEQTDAESFAVLEPRIDGFRNYAGGRPLRSLEEHLIDRAQLLTLTAPEMTVLVGGLRVLGANHGGAAHGVFTDRVGVLSNDFFINLLKSSYEAKWTEAADGSFTAKSRKTGDIVGTGSRVDLVFGSNSQLRALAEAYASADAGKAFVDAFIKAWVKVMNLDRFDLR